MAAGVASAASFDIGRVISRLFGVLGRNLVSFVLLSVLLVGAPTAVVSLIQLSYLAPAHAGVLLGILVSPLRLTMGLGAFLVSVAANAVLQGAIIHGTVSDLAGRRASFGESLGAGMRLFLPLVVIGVIDAVGIFLGAILFIVPGVILALAWSVAVPARVMEQVSIAGAFGRSVELTRRHRGAIFVLALLLFATGLIVQVLANAASGVGFGFGGAAAAMASRPGVGFGAYMYTTATVGLVVRTAMATLGSAGVASLYFELRQVKEGVGAHELAAVFD